MKTILSLIGETPLLKLERITRGLNVKIYVKCEHLNPSGSIKDRMALRMIEEAENSRQLTSDHVIIEETSGNTGPALAFVGGVKGYPVRIFIPSEWTGTYNPQERVNIMKFFGAQVETYSLKPFQDLLSNLREEEKSAASFVLGMKKCYELKRASARFWWPNQMCNPHNALAHKDTTGREILEQLDQIDAWVASIGTGGTLLGVAEAIQKEHAVTVVGVEPMDAHILEWVNSGLMDDLLTRFKLPKMTLLTAMMIDKGLPDRVIRVPNATAREMAYRLCQEEGLFCGFSSGANVCAAIEVAKQLGKTSNVVTVIVDRRDRYFSEHPHEHYVV